MNKKFEWIKEYNPSAGMPYNDRIKMENDLKELNEKHFYKIQYNHRSNDFRLIDIFFDYVWKDDGFPFVFKDINEAIIFRKKIENNKND